MVSEKKIKELDQSAVELTLTVPAEQVRSSYDEVVKKYAKSIQIKGFRKGKVPVNVLESKYGDALKEESMVNLMDEALKEAVDQVEDNHKPLPFSQPTLVDEEKVSLDDLDRDFTFSVTYDVKPEIKLETYSGYEIEVPDVTIPEEDIDEELAALQDQNALVSEVDKAAEEKDIITVNYWELDEQDSEKADTRRDEFTFTIGSGYNYYQFDEEVKGMKKGDSKLIEKEYPEDFSEQNLAGRTVKLQVEVTAVKQRDIPELDDEFAQDVSDDYDTLDDLKADIRKRLTEELENKMKDYKLGKLVNRIIEDHPIELPESMVQAQLEDSWNNYLQRTHMPEENMLKFLEMHGMSKEKILENWREDAVVSLKHSMVMEELVKKETVEVTDEEVDAEVEKELKAAGMEERPEIRDYLNQAVTEQLKHRKAADLLIEKNTFKPGEQMALDEFINGKQEDEEDGEEPQEEV